jgi:hypothetical protein
VKRNIHALQSPTPIGILTIQVGRAQQQIIDILYAKCFPSMQIDIMHLTEPEVSISSSPQKPSTTPVNSIETAVRRVMFMVEMHVKL